MHYAVILPDFVPRSDSGAAPHSLGMSFCVFVMLRHEVGGVADVASVIQDMDAIGCHGRLAPKMSAETLRHIKKSEIEPSSGSSKAPLHFSTLAACQGNPGIARSAPCCSISRLADRQISISSMTRRRLLACRPKKHRAKLSNAWARITARISSWALRDKTASPKPDGRSISSS